MAGLGDLVPCYYGTSHLACTRDGAASSVKRGFHYTNHRMDKTRVQFMEWDEPRFLS